MNVNGEHYRTIWVKDNEPGTIQIIDQNKLPFNFEIMDLKSVEDFRLAIKEMHVRGAGLIGASAGYGMYIAALEASKDNFDEDLRRSADILIATRPTASNLAWAVNRQINAIAEGKNRDEKVEIAFKTARDIADEDADFCRRIGEHGKNIIEEISKKKAGDTVNILTHCNAGWLAFVDYGSATAPIYAAYEAGIKLHVWVDETRPRNQGANLTAWELGQHGIDHHLIVDNAGGYLMQQGQVDMVIVGSDRTARNGDVANKIGTYLKALAAWDNDVPFYVALPSSTLDFTIKNGVKGIPIEERDDKEVRYIIGKNKDNQVGEVLLCPEITRAKNYGFDVTPSKYVTKLICERGICDASEEGLLSLFPEEKG